MRPTDDETKEIAARVDAMDPAMEREAGRLGLSVDEYRRLLIGGYQAYDPQPGRPYAQWPLKVLGE